MITQKMMLVPFCFCEQTCLFVQECDQAVPMHAFGKFVCVCPLLYKHCTYYEKRKHTTVVKIIFCSNLSFAHNEKPIDTPNFSVEPKY